MSVAQTATRALPPAYRDTSPISPHATGHKTRECLPLQPLGPEKMAESRPQILLSRLPKFDGGRWAKPAPRLDALMYCTYLPIAPNKYSGGPHRCRRSSTCHGHHPTVMFVFICTLVMFSLFAQLILAQSTMDTSTITALTHDTSSAAFHIADFSSLLSHLTDAVAAAWPDRLTARYGKVKVLLMSWERDDLGVEAEIRPLEAVLRGLYHYDTEMWKIPSKRPAVELSRKIADLVDAYGREGNLLIFYYAGHARPSEQPGGGPVWAAK